MSSTIAAAKACAHTLLFHALRLHAFRGAAPHVLLVVDPTPCVQQKVVVEGYLQVLDEYNANPASYLERMSGADSAAPCCNQPQGSDGSLYISLDPSTATPSGSGGLACGPSTEESTPLTYSLFPFRPSSFTAEVTALQNLLRHCGDGQSASPAWSKEDFQKHLEPITALLRPLPGRPTRYSGEEETNLAASLYDGPQRELLGCILVQRNAFQNELHQYRLRLALFDMGMRVVEHCHLQIMSERADELAKNGDFVGALSDDEVYSYARSCSFRPEVAHSMAKGIADAIDLYSWQREGPPQKARRCDDSSSPPAALRAALESDRNHALFREGSLVWGRDDSGAAAVPSTAAVEDTLRCTIVGPGAPLRIICHDSTKVLAYEGGMEDCLMNTGYYDAAFTEERNNVHHHRSRFVIEAESPTEKREDEAPAAPPQGRLKKKEYLALLKSKGQKPNKPARLSSTGDVGEENDATGTRAPAGSCISNSIGGTFPIGEVISESFDLSQLHGTCDVFAYPDVFKKVTMSKPAPFTMTIEAGVVTKVSEGAPDEFTQLLGLVRQVEGACYVRELGIGLNPFVGRQHVVNDVTTFERQWGIHLSLGQRHPLFVKQAERRNADGTVATGVTVQGPVLKRKAGKYHIDVFVDAAQLSIGAFTMDFTKGVAVV